MSVHAVSLQVLVGALRAACEEMGAVLIRSAHSPNIKERRDCSTALFDPEGRLVMQAEHIPVHLGSMPDAVAAILGREQIPGKGWILNDPFEGGTHLPDITLIRPVFADDAGRDRSAGEQGSGGRAELLGFAASRAHHADVGGPTPGGMPADSTRLDEEGIMISPRLDNDLESLADQMRNPRQRLADLRAQQAANLTGESRLRELHERLGSDGLREGTEAILDYAERRTRAALEAVDDGTWEASDVLEGGADGSEDIELRVRATLRGSNLELDFTGSAQQVEGNLNCPLAVTKSASFFAVRALTDPDAPASAGAHRPVEVIAPKGCVLNARPGAAVVAGNVETSSRVADLVLDVLADALDGPAQGQGTMNNLTLASTKAGGFTYYETLGGGQGACSDADGPSAVHVAMSNTLNTPIEALEQEMPVRVRELGLRRGSGGEGRHRGGDGIVREIEALEPMSFSLITERRRHRPKGRAGGEDGLEGRNLLNGEPLPAKCTGELAPGDVLRLETPGGGGWGARGSQHLSQG
ncbi:hydantoinase B/oxoprolinase family protein [soil metagenome]